eukprot:TRINITY_DN1376_c0_g1_i5.p1 TRINITY_DN1376_c0_g1~~TRINITY_DN1376_c0_g1_i5.p1  ORF type:complete len:318 (-),score=16.17 TRINITY_DN1376_c0_g1_i5:631-1476(-)
MAHCMSLNRDVLVSVLFLSVCVCPSLGSTRSYNRHLPHSERFAESSSSASHPIADPSYATLKLRHVFRSSSLQKLGLSATDKDFHLLLARRDGERTQTIFSTGVGGAKKRSHEEVSVTDASNQPVEDIPESERDSLFHVDTLRGQMKATKSSVTSNFPLQGNLYPIGLYTVEVGLGTPRQSFNLDIDTGSSLTWVNCYPCQPCTTSSTVVRTKGFSCESAEGSNTKHHNEPGFFLRAPPNNKAGRVIAPAVEPWTSWMASDALLMRHLIHYAVPRAPSSFL